MSFLNYNNTESVSHDLLKLNSAALFFLMTSNFYLFIIFLREKLKTNIIITKTSLQIRQRD